MNRTIRKRTRKLCSRRRDCTIREPWFSGWAHYAVIIWNILKPYLGSFVSLGASFGSPFSDILLFFPERLDIMLVLPWDMSSVAVKPLASGFVTFELFGNSRHWLQVVPIRSFLSRLPTTALNYFVVRISEKNREILSFNPGRSDFWIVDIGGLSSKKSHFYKLPQTIAVWKTDQILIQKI